MTLDLYMECSKISSQIPEGMVSTYGAIARALGDDRARRAVGVMMNTYKSRTPMPCHRVVYHDGALGGFAYGPKEKIKRLATEGVKVKNGQIVDFENIYFTDFKTLESKPLETARKGQLKLARKVKVEEAVPIPDTILGLDVSYSGINAYGAGVLYDLEKMESVKIIRVKSEVKFPYVPTYLGFREIPIFKEIVRKLKKPTILMPDGNGILHPFGFGLASHIGVELNTPSIGVAKTRLCGELNREPTKTGSSETITLDGKVIGHSLKTSERAKPVYVSPGHLISHGKSLELTKKLARLKLPEPIRLAHIEATKFRKEGQ
jgi:deoxyribonuclease V